MLDRPAIAVVKLAQVYIARRQETLGEIQRLLTRNVTGSGLEIFIGRQLMLENSSVKGNIRLLIPDDPWYTDSLSLRAHNNGYKTRASN